MFVIPLAQWSPALWQPTLLLGGRVLSLVGLSFFFVHGAPYLMAVTAGDWQNRALAWQSASLAVAGFVGGLLGGYLPGWIASWMALPLSDPTPYQYPLFLGAAVFGLAFFAFWRTPEPVLVESLALARGETAVSLHPLSTPKWTGSIPLFVVMMLLVRALQVAAPGAILTFANVFFDDGLHVATSKIGVITAVGKLLSIPVALATPWAMARWGGFRVVIIISLVSVVGALPMALSDNWILAGLGYVLAAAAGPLRYLAFLVFTLSLVHSDYRATISGAGEMAIGFGFALMAFVGGYLIANYGYGLFFGVSLGLTLVGTGLYWLIFRGYR
jgi:MFS family permease